MADSCVDPKNGTNYNLGMKAESIDSGLESENVTDKMATYILIDSRDVLNLTFTPQSMKVIYNLATHFTQRDITVTDFPNVLAIDFESPINLINDIGMHILKRKYLIFYHYHYNN